MPTRNIIVWATYSFADAAAIPSCKIHERHIGHATALTNTAVTGTEVSDAAQMKPAPIGAPETFNRKLTFRWCGREDSNFHGLPR